MTEAFGPEALSVTLRERRRAEISNLLAPKRAAVAITLRSGAQGPEVLLMQRVERAEDRWSGQVSFPGGKAEAEDASLLHTALREMGEEVGLWLDEDAMIGVSDDQVAMARGKVLPMAITPYVFELKRPNQQLELGPEASDAFWVPLADLESGAYDDAYQWRQGPLRHTLPCWRWRDRVIWGLTYGMLRRLLDIGRGRG